MKSNDKIALGALIVSILSILVATTTFFIRGSFDLDSLRDAVGDASKPSGLYAQVDIAKRDALTATTLSESSKEVSKEARNVALKAEKTATSAEKDAESALDKITIAVKKADNSKTKSEKAQESAQEALSVSQNALLNVVPIGTILAWIPTDNMPTPPEGWKVCDGTNGAPNLEGRFLIGVRHLNKTQQKGGRADIPGQGNHSHGGATTSVNANRITYDRGGDNNGVWFNHSHGIRGDGSHDHGGENRPPFFTVIYIIKTS